MKNELDTPVKQTVSKRILEILGDKRVRTRRALAELVGVEPQSVTNWIKRGQIKNENAIKIQEILGYDMGWILANDVAITNIGDNQAISGSTVTFNTANKITHGTALMAQSEQDASHTHRIDYLDVRAAAGLTGFENSDYPEIVSSLFLSDEGLLQIIGRKSAAGIKIVNVPTDSMEPTIRKGDWVFLDTNIDYYNGDGVYAFAIDNALFIKRIQKLVGGGYRLHSDNKDYDPQDITDEICQTAKFVGRFIKTIHIDVVSL